MGYTFLGNSCVSGWVYNGLKLKYNNPFIWHLVLDDADFLDVCRNFEHYITQEPTFVENDEKNGRYLNHPSISKRYPIMQLDGVNFHFIHHHDNDVVLAKFNNRVERLLTDKSELICVAWDKEIKTEAVLAEFTKLDNSIVATNVTSQLDAANQIIEKWKVSY